MLASPLLFESCTYKSAQALVDVTGQENYELYDYYVDEYGNEGIVAFIPNKYSNQYMIVISADEVLLPWGPMDDRVCILDSVTQGMIVNPSFGLSMLQTMTGRDISRYPAMAWCNTKNGSENQPSGSSWRLPSRRELALIFGSIKERLITADYAMQMQYLNEALRDIGGTEIDPHHIYWTCQEDYEGLYPQEEGNFEDFDPENRALAMKTDNTLLENKNLWIKKSYYYVRAIKYIFYERRY